MKKWIDSIGWIFFAVFFSYISADPEVPSQKSLPADLTFVIADFKYNDTQGVQICEIQPGSLSVFGGYDFLNEGYGLVPEMFLDCIGAYSVPIWYIPGDVCDKKLLQLLEDMGAKKVNNLQKFFKSEEFQNIAMLPPEHPENIDEYGGILYVRNHRLKSMVDFSEKYPGIIFMDAAFVPYDRDKYLINSLLSSHPLTFSLKPLWNLYNCEYSKEFVERILNTFKSEMLVIKPRNGTKGKGVIVLHRDDLDKTLKYLFGGGSEGIDPNDFSDSSYRYWKKGKKGNGTFLLEEFIMSDPVYPEWFNGKPYDGTVRAVVMLSYHQKQIHVKLLEAHWKLPKKSIEDIGTLTELHKSYGKAPHFYAIEPEKYKKMESQLCQGLTIMYQKMLGINRDFHD
jgi:hypothetical protein